jgi:hypothetical protein
MWDADVAGLGNHQPHLPNVERNHPPQNTFLLSRGIYRPPSNNPPRDTEVLAPTLSSAVFWDGAAPHAQSADRRRDRPGRVPCDDATPAPLKRRSRAVERLRAPFRQLPESSAKFTERPLCIQGPAVSTRFCHAAIEHSNGGHTSAPLWPWVTSAPSETDWTCDLWVEPAAAHRRRPNTVSPSSAYICPSHS